MAKPPKYRYTGTKSTPTKGVEITSRIRLKDEDDPTAGQKGETFFGREPLGTRVFGSPEAPKSSGKRALSAFLNKQVEEALKNLQPEPTTPKHKYIGRKMPIGQAFRRVKTKSLIATIKKLHPVEVTVTEVNDFWQQQSLVKNFLLENSDEFAEIEMCRSLPIFVYADRPVELDLLKAWIAEMGFSQLTVLPPLEGSWLGRFFASHPVPTTKSQFWDRISTKDFLETAGKISLLPATVAIIGTLVVHQDAVKAAAATATAASAQKTTQSAPVQPPAPPPTVVKVEVNAVKKSVSIMVQAASPEEALKISQEMMRQAQAMQAGPTPASKTPTKRTAAKSSKKAPQKKASKAPSPKLMQVQATTGRKFRDEGE